MDTVEEYSKVLARYVTKLRFEDLGEDVVRKAKLHFLDSLGNILGAGEMPWSKMVIEVVKKTGGAPRSRGDPLFSLSTLFSRRSV